MHPSEDVTSKTLRVTYGRIELSIMSNCELLARITTNKVCAVALAHRTLLVAAVLVSVDLGAALPVSAESVSAKEKPLYIGDFGARYSSWYDEFRMPNDARAKWRAIQLQNAGYGPSTREPGAWYGVRSYTSYQQLIERPRLYNLKRGYSAGPILPSPLLNGAGVEQLPVGDSGPRRRGASNVTLPARSMLFQSLDSLNAESALRAKEFSKTQKNPARATRFEFTPNVWKIEQKPAPSR